MRFEQKKNKQQQQFCLTTKKNKQQQKEFFIIVGLIRKYLVISVKSKQNILPRMTRLNL